MNTNPKSISRRVKLSGFSLFFAVFFILLKGLVFADTQILRDGWQLRSSADVSVSGEKISTTQFETTGWYSTSIPSTVLSALVKNRVYRDVFYGKNLETIAHEPFQTSWWYRKEFDVDDHSAHEQVTRLIFDGINYSANIFVNGTKIASADQTFGAFRRFDFDISRLARKSRNVLAVEIIPPKPGDFTIGFVDWNPIPPDRNMGIWREVKLRTSGAVSIENPAVQSKIDLQTLKQAELTVSATLSNHSNRKTSGQINGELEGGVKFTQTYSLAPNETKAVRFSADNASGLTIQNPRLWWPNNLGNPELYNLKLTASDSEGVSDNSNITFGIREVADYMNKEGHRGYMINGKKVLIRGGGWADDLLLNEDPKNLEAQFRYVKHLNLNTVRLEGFWGSSEKLYDLADRYGLLVMVGFSCQWEWTHYLGKEADEPYGGVQSEEDMRLVTQYLRDQVIWLRNHPGIFVWVIGSDDLPNPEAEKRYRASLAELDPSRPVLASCKGWTSKVSGPTAVKMNGPYDYVTPNYWYLDKENGGAFGFNTETGPGPQPPPLESIQRMFSPDHYWPIDDTWNYHCGRNEFNNMDRYLNAFNHRYGEAEDVYDFTKRSQAANYEAIRAMFESFGVNKPVTTGIVQWMLNASWPKMYWQLYDYYLMPGGAFYGTRKANQPLNLAYNYGDGSIYLVNDKYEEYPALNAEIKILSIGSKELLSKKIKASIGANESKRIFQLPRLNEAAYFVSLKLKDAAGTNVADNFYWLSAKPDLLDSKKSEWYYTPNKSFADFTSLNKLSPVDLQIEQNATQGGMTIHIKNPSPHLAFFVELKLVGDKTGRSVLPILWDDNYVSLLPGETKEITAKFSAEDLNGEKPMLQYSGWNVKSH